jgi:type IV pilus assembly protein PilX
MNKPAVTSPRAGVARLPGAQLTGRKQTGYVLVVSMVLLVVLTILAVSMFRSFGLQELMAGNLREKTRAVDAAQTAINYAEWWLTQGNNATTGVACAGVVNAPVVCNTAIVNATANAAWPIGVNYNPNPAYMPVSANGGVTGGITNYFQAPQFYIQYVGLAAGGTGALYRITSKGWGGNSAAVAVLQSTYIISTGVKPLTGP